MGDETALDRMTTISEALYRQHEAEILRLASAVYGDNRLAMKISHDGTDFVMALGDLSPPEDQEVQPLPTGRI